MKGITQQLCKIENQAKKKPKLYNLIYFKSFIIQFSRQTLFLLFVCKYVSYKKITFKSLECNPPL